MDFMHKKTVKILKIGTPKIITVIGQLEQLDFFYSAVLCLKDAGRITEYILIRLFLEEQSDLGLHCSLRPICPNTLNYYSSSARYACKNTPKSTMLYGKPKAKPRNETQVKVEIT